MRFALLKQDFAAWYTVDGFLEHAAEKLRFDALIEVACVH